MSFQILLSSSVISKQYSPLFFDKYRCPALTFVAVTGLSYCTPCSALAATCSVTTGSTQSWFVDFVSKMCLISTDFSSSVAGYSFISNGSCAACSAGSYAISGSAKCLSYVITVFFCCSYFSLTSGSHCYRCPDANSATCSPTDGTTSSCKASFVRTTGNCSLCPSGQFAQNQACTK